MHSVLITPAVLIDHFHCQGAARPTQHSELPLRLPSTSAWWFHVAKSHPRKCLLQNGEHDDKPASLCRNLQQCTMSSRRELLEKCSKAACFRGKTESNIFFFLLVGGPFCQNTAVLTKKEVRSEYISQIWWSSCPPALVCSLDSFTLNSRWCHFLRQACVGSWCSKKYIGCIYGLHPWHTLFHTKKYPCYSGYGSPVNIRNIPNIQMVFYHFLSK